LTPKASVEKRAHSAPTPASLSPVESISRTASAILRRKPRLAPASMASNSPEKTRKSRLRLASAKVERFGAAAPQ
jgi:hypothetical protein